VLEFARLKHNPGGARKRARQRFEASARARGRLACSGKVAQDVRIANEVRQADGREPIELFPAVVEREICCRKPDPPTNKQQPLCCSVAEHSGQPLVPEPEEHRHASVYRLLDRLRPISRNSTARCRRFRTAKTVQVFVDPTGDCRVRLSGVETCHNVWGCPVCALALQIRRGGEIEFALGRWKGDEPDRIGPRDATAYMLTLTVRHHSTHDLREVFDVVAEAYGNFFAGRAGQRLHRSLGISHHVRAAELTWSHENGWHPHLHVVIFTTRPLREDEIEALNDRWHTAVRGTAAFRQAFAPNQDHGFRCRELWLQSDGTYLQKMFQELTGLGKQAAEDHLTYWQVAEAATSGDAKMYRVWRHAQKALYRRKQLTWSKGAKDAFGIPDLTDEMLSDEDGIDATELGKTLEIEIPGLIWDEGFRRDPLFLSTTLAAVSVAVRSGDYSSLLALLSERLARQGGGSDCLRDATRDFCSALARQLSKSCSTEFNEAGVRGAVVRAAS
jgi:hypothetical protein